MLTNTDPTIAGGSASGVPSGTPVQGGVVSTPAQPTVDDVEKWKTQYDQVSAQMEELKSRYERDIGGVKSSLQSQQAELTRQWASERDSWEQERFALATKGMTEQERLTAERDLYAQRVAREEELRAQLQLQLENAQRIPEYLATFGAMGVDVTKLPVNDPVALVNEGWNQLVANQAAMKAKLADYEAKANQGVPSTAPGGTLPSAAAPTQAGVQAPAVASQTSGGAASGRSWDDVLRLVSAQYGRPMTREDVYQLVEQQVLPHTIIPGLENL